MQVSTADGATPPCPLVQETPEVIVPRGRAHLTYARAGNLILPLRFALKMTEWRRPGRVSWAATNRRRVQARWPHPRRRDR
ncbi:MAG TPA: hypothetical protein VNO55_31435 [Polyangia bacterium]|nr:hypothetical protein [Polyangia bacterium]